MKKRMSKNNATINQTAATETATTNIQEGKEMKENTLWATIKNGIKRAIKFVVDILLFVPRVIFYGVSHMVASLCLKASVAEEYDTDGYEFVDEEYPEVVIEEENKEVSAETSLTKKELRKQAREERKEAKAAAKEEKASKVETAVEVIEEAKAEEAIVETKEAVAASELVQAETLPVIENNEHIHELRKDDIGVLELSVLDNMEYAGSEKVYNVPRQFVHAYEWGESTHNAMCALLQAWCDRLNIAYPAFDGTYQPYNSMINSLKELSEINEEEASALTTRVGRYYTPNYLEASRIQNIIYTVMCKYFKRFYGSWVLYDEFNDAWFELRNFFRENKPMPRYNKDEALKYFPLDESLKGINLEAPFCLGNLSGKCPEKQR